MGGFCGGDRGGILALLVCLQLLQTLFSEALAGDTGSWWEQWGRCGFMELGLRGCGHGGAVGVGDSASAVRAVAQAELFLLVPSSGGTYNPREDSGAMHRPRRPGRPRSDPEAPAQQSGLKPLSISHPSVVPVSPDRTGTPGSGPPSATMTKIILESGRSSLGGPFSPGTTTGARRAWEVKGQRTGAGDPRPAPVLGGTER